jgi:hypothetical protein
LPRHFVSSYVYAVYKSLFNNLIFSNMKKI